MFDPEEQTVLDLLYLLHPPATVGCLTAVGHMIHLRKTCFTLELRKGSLVASFSIAWTSKPFRSSLYL